MADERDKENEETGREDGDAEAAPSTEPSEPSEAQASGAGQEASDGGEHELMPLTGMLGVERWVQFAFIALAAILFLVADQLIETVWIQVAENLVSNIPDPDPTLVSGTALLVGILVSFGLYRHPRANEFAHEVVDELSKVTWPTREETYTSTVVVIVTSIIAAIYTGAFDAVWSAFTDLIYNV